ncbi:MAG: bifunctional (p)ppGpp synthetase/guanosine-3',5'-bis(diphosphate) 3'-pyrophosphohydrolase [Ruminococcaceae bacterium]|nr:bifunctional (p)ppGpp synthetase/guanosine-3',5'-bis(diphosphate) 3'-pyrophosphohydrolase [Oscillospiraceae bacterium]
MTKIDLTPEESELVGKLFSVLETSGKKYNMEKIAEAFRYATEMHEGQFRNSGEPYIVHPIAVAEIAAALGLDTDSICAAFLHDTIEDCPDKTDFNKIKAKFGEDVANLVDGLTKMEDIAIEDKEEAQMENIRKMLLAMSKDIRVIFIKLCDRLHNMRTLDAKPEHKRRTTALETMHVYAPLAHRLGIQRIKQELENLAVRYLDPIGYAEVSENIERKYGQNRDFIEKVRSYISDRLDEYKIEYRLEGRVKTVYSIYRKMFNQNKSFDEIYDFYALRIIVDTELDCYTALGIIHELFKSMPGRFKDYISTPKPNMYQSLHTTVIGRDGIPFEVQIRTKDMHHVAEYGIAAHWKYKSGERSREEIDEKLAWISKLVDTENETVDPDEFMSVLKNDIFNDETFVFTPKGDVVALPQGSTIIDFAYSIHTQVGNRMIGAKINGMIAPIDRIPQNGEIVEILTSQASKGPSRDWLKIVKTSEARNKIRQWFKKEKRSDNIEVGRGDIERELAKISRRLTDDQKLSIVSAVAKRIGIQDAEDLYNTVGYGGLAMSKIIPKLKDEFEKQVKPLEEEAPITNTDQVKTAGFKKSNNNGGIIVDGQYGCAVKFAKCCNPLPGDPVIGFITKGYGISIHKRDCPNVMSGMKSPEFFNRWIHAEWDNDALVSKNKTTFEAMIQIFAFNSISLIADITIALADMKVSILQINTKKRTNDDIIINLTIACKDTEHFTSIVSRLKSIDNVTNIVRGFS